MQVSFGFAPRSRRRSALALCGAGLLLAACGGKDGLNQPPEPGDVAVAKVNNQTIWTSDVRREATSEGLIAEGEALAVTSEPFHRALDEVIDQKLLAAEAVKRGLQDAPATRRRLAAARERILGDTLVEIMVEQAANDGAIRSLYQEQLKLTKPAEEFHARQIITTTQSEADAVKKLLDSGASFEALAMSRSIDAATRFNGGDLGYFTADVMPDTYAAALKSAKAGTVAGPFKADAGWVLLKVEDRRPEAPISLEQARPQIVRFLTYDEVRDLIEKLRGKNQVKLLIASAPGAGGRDAASDPSPVGASAAERALTLSDPKLQRKTP